MRPQDKARIKVVPAPKPTYKHSTISHPKERSWRLVSAGTLAYLAHTGKVTLQNVQAAFSAGVNIKSFQREFWRLLAEKKELGQREWEVFQQFHSVLN